MLTLTPGDLVNKMEPIFLLHFIKRQPTYRTGKAVGHVQDCLIASLTDKDPLAERVSIVESWILRTAKHCSCPDAFQHACVHLKY